jgi:hypothetical protein
MPLYYLSADTNGDDMKSKKHTIADEDSLRPEYDLSTLKQVGERGRHARARREGYTTVVKHADGSKTIIHHQVHPGAVVLDADVREYFPDSEAVNTALRGLIALLPKRRSRRKKPG